MGRFFTQSRPVLVDDLGTIGNTITFFNVEADICDFVFQEHAEHAQKIIK
jgi:hypothetical protein